MLKTIALIDGSLYAHSVCDAAAWVSARNGAAVELLHVLGRREGAADGADLSGNIGLGARTALLEELAELDARKAKLTQKRGRALLDEARSRLEEAGVGTVTTSLRYGDLAETVQALEVDANLLIVGKRGEAADFAKLHLGSNLERVVRTTRRPVLVTSRAFKPVSKVLVAFDGGASALKAIEYMSGSKVFERLEVELLMVGDDSEANRAQLEAAAQQLRARDIAASCAVKAGVADKVIAERVEQGDIDMLVMGAYGHSRIRTLIIGSTTTEMIRSCLVPIMLFR